VNVRDRIRFDRPRNQIVRLCSRVDYEMRPECYFVFECKAIVKTTVARLFPSNEQLLITLLEQ
jgi:hypothetical protein